MLTTIGRGIDKLSVLTGYISAALLLVLCFVVSYEVVVRKIGIPTTWAFDVANWLQLAIIFAGMAYAQKEFSHIKVDLLTRHYPIKLQVIIRLIAYTGAVIVSFIFFWQGLALVADSYTSNNMAREMTRIPVWWVQWPIPLGAFIIMLQFLRHMADDVAWMLSDQTTLPEDMVPSEEKELQEAIAELDKTPIGAAAKQ